MLHFVPDHVIESIYSKEVFPQFGLKTDDVLWNGHSGIGPDSVANFFIQDGKEFMLIYEDYPLLSEEDIAELVTPAKRLIPIRPAIADAHDALLDYSSNNSGAHGVGIDGTFRLYKIE